MFVIHDVNLPHGGLPKDSTSLAHDIIDGPHADRFDLLRTLADRGLCFACGEVSSGARCWRCGASIRLLPPLGAPR